MENSEGWDMFIWQGMCLVRIPKVETQSKYDKSLCVGGGGMVGSSTPERQHQRNIHTLGEHEDYFDSLPR